MRIGAIGTRAIRRSYQTDCLVRPMTPTSDTPTRASRTLLWYSVALAVILYLDRVCISQSQAQISAELGL